MGEKKNLLSLPVLVEGDFLCSMPDVTFQKQSSFKNIVFYLLLHNDQILLYRPFCRFKIIYSQAGLLTKGKSVVPSPPSFQEGIPNKL